MKIFAFPAFVLFVTGLFHFVMDGGGFTIVELFQLWATTASILSTFLVTLLAQLPTPDIELDDIDLEDHCILSPIFMTGSYLLWLVGYIVFWCIAPWYIAIGAFLFGIGGFSTYRLKLNDIIDGRYIIVLWNAVLVTCILIIDIAIQGGVR